MRLSVGKKLGFLLIGLLSTGIGGAVIMSTQLFTSDLVGQMRREVIDSSTLLSNRTRSDLQHLVEKGQLLGALSLEEFKYLEDRVELIESTLAQDPRIVSASLWGAEGEALWTIVSPAHQALRSPASNTPASDTAASDSVASRGPPPLRKEDLAFRRYDDQSPQKKLLLEIPLVRNSQGQLLNWLRLEVLLERTLNQFQDVVGTHALLIDERAQVLGSSNADLFPLGKDLSKHELVKLGQSLKTDVGQTDFDVDGENRSGAFQNLGLGGLSVLTISTSDRASEAKQKLFKRTGLMSLLFLFLSLAAGLRFSEGLTKPLQALRRAAQYIQEGQFGVRINIKRPWFERGFKEDEVHEVAKVFNEMAKGLGEREKMKNVFEKFHSKAIATKLLNGQLQLGGTQCEASVCFIDIRGFTTLSEKLPAEAIVKLLNRYLEAMVHVIIESGGVVDKFLGDGIMALWGIPEQSPDDLSNSLQAALGLRQALSQLNEELVSEGLTPLQIGIGLHHGRLIAGNIGSQSRMEYTAIGDTVNTASRIQDLTKKFECDLLVSESVALPLWDKFNFESVGENDIRGRKEKLVLYRVVDEASIERTPRAPGLPPPPPKMKLAA